MQLFLIHGGETFLTHEEYIASLKSWTIDFDRYLTEKKDWKRNLQERLGKEYQVIAPSMPNKSDAHYDEWKIWFEKFIPFMEQEVIFAGHSLGGIFLAKYLFENSFPKKVKGLFLVAAPYNDPSLGTFRLEGNAKGAFGINMPGAVFLYYSRDDRSVPFEDAESFKGIFPSAITRVFDNKGHFRDEEFPEIVADIKSL